MKFLDLANSDYDYQCFFSGDAVDSWHYDLEFKNDVDRFVIQLSCWQIRTLRENCALILKATEDCELKI